MARFTGRRAAALCSLLVVSAALVGTGSSVGAATNAKPSKVVHKVTPGCGALTAKEITSVSGKKVTATTSSNLSTVVLCTYSLASAPVLRMTLIDKVATKSFTSTRSQSSGNGNSVKIVAKIGTSAFEVYDTTQPASISGFYVLTPAAEVILGGPPLTLAQFEALAKDVVAAL